MAWLWCDGGIGSTGPWLLATEGGSPLALGEYPYTWLVVTSMIAFFVLRLGVGFWAARQVTDAADYIVAGRRLPIYVAGASIMATWFAAETLMGAAATAYKHGFQGVIFDPFGAVLCLLISGLFIVLSASICLNLSASSGVRPICLIRAE